MADPHHDPGTGNDTGRRTPPHLPRWVKVSAIIVGVLVLLVVVLKLTGVGGEHGPGRHISGGDTPPASVTHEQAPLTGGQR
ncbi:MAG: hypothetical protein ACRDSL_09850 [Pseudonocardiaceae bacterium]